MTSAFAICLTAILSLGIVPWSASPVAAEAAGDPVVSFGWPTVSPTRVAAGARVTISINAQGKALDTPGPLTYVVRAVDPAGASTEIDRQENVTFAAWQTRRFTSSWTIPATFLLGISTLRFEMIAATGTVVAARDGSVAVLTAGDDGSAPTATPAPTRTATPTSPPPTMTPTPTSTPATGGGAGRPPRRCDQEFQIVGAADFVSSIWNQLATISSVSPADYNRTMSCSTDPSTGRTMTEVRRIVQSDPPYSTVNGYAYYSDSSGTIWTRKGAGPLAASQLVHEAAHITTTGWNMPGGSCEPENLTLEIQARFLDRAADQQADPAQASALRFYASWFRQQKGVHNCPA